MTRFFPSCAMFAIVAYAGATIAGDNGPSDKDPRNALDHYVGSWEVEIVSKGLPFTKGQVKTQWILDGGFIQQTGELRAKDGAAIVKTMTIMTYDPNKKAYRSWTFVSNGSTTESEGIWDAKARIMTFVSRKDEGGTYSTTTADFAEAGVEKWNIVYTDRKGKVVSEMSGKNTRKPK